MHIVEYGVRVQRGNRWAQTAWGGVAAPYIAKHSHARALCSGDSCWTVFNHQAIGGCDVHLAGCVKEKVRRGLAVVYH